MVRLKSAGRFMLNFHFFFLSLLFYASCTTAVNAADSPMRLTPPPVSPVIWQANLPNFSDSTYAVSVEQLIAQF